MVAVHPFWNEGLNDLKVLTWNVRCPEGADYQRQEAIAELVLEVDADFVQLNEYNQDSCFVTDSILKIRYPFTEEYQSHRRCGDIFYSKQPMDNSGHVYIPVLGKGIPTIKASIAVGSDSVQIFVGSGEAWIAFIGLSTHGHLKVGDGEVCGAYNRFHQLKAGGVVVFPC